MDGIRVPSAPIARLHAELYEIIRTKDWSLVGGLAFPACGTSTRPIRIAIGDGAAGVGYGAPGSVGGALANRKHGRLSVAIQTDGDLMYGPGALWTAAHHRIPLLSVMHNNRAYHQEVMHVQRMANRHQRGIENADVNTTVSLDPNIDFAIMVRGAGCPRQGTHHRSQRPWPSDTARARRSRTQRRTCSRRRRHATPLEATMRYFILLAMACALGAQALQATPRTARRSSSRMVVINATITTPRAEPVPG